MFLRVLVFPENFLKEEKKASDIAHYNLNEIKEYTMLEIWLLVKA